MLSYILTIFIIVSSILLFIVINILNKINKNNITNINKLLIKKNCNNANIPKLSSQYAAGYDLFSVEEGIIKPNERKMINTGIIMEIPQGLYGRVAPRSGLALKNGINVMAGVIDCDYRNEVKVILHNTDNKDYVYMIGDRIAQIIFENYNHLEIIEKNEISQTNRGIGFGSSGK